MNSKVVVTAGDGLQLVRWLAGWPIKGGGLVRLRPARRRAQPVSTDPATGEQLHDHQNHGDHQQQV